MRRADRTIGTCVQGHRSWRLWGLSANLALQTGKMITGTLM